ncbi:hypothetical protein [uncultured Thiohalocapsa sp.]|uniref:hypothetical protein n=1 Tax=uncultured Thiohalocapsa sp. TaxID=768990 RepID=UPI0025D6EEE5|nr:hypothetical protein [uncultured Thiohalocapsa sp.]
MHRLLIIGHSPLFAAGIRRIAKDAGLAVSEVVQAYPEDEAHLPAADRFDAAVVAVAAPDDAGTAAIGALARLPDGPPVLALSAPCESVYGVRLLRLGARSVIAAQASPQEIAAALSRTLAGRRHVSAALADHLAAHLAAAAAPAQMRLRDALASDAQLRLVQLLALGKPMGVICDLLRLSAEDAHAERRDILRRTGAADEQELKRRVFEQRLVPDRRGRGAASGHTHPAEHRLSQPWSHGASGASAQGASA